MIKTAILILIITFSGKVVAYQDDTDIQSGWGVEYKFNSGKRVSLFAFSSRMENFSIVENKVYFSPSQKRFNSSCVPSEDDPDGAKCGMSHLMVYLIALPASLYLYNEAFESTK